MHSVYFLVVSEREYLYIITLHAIWYHLSPVIQCFAFEFGGSLHCPVSLQISGYLVALWPQIASLKGNINLHFPSGKDTLFIFTHS